MSQEDGLIVIDKIQFEYYRKPKGIIRSPEVLETISNKNFAFHEVRNFVLMHPEMDPIDALDVFRKKMDNYQIRARTWTAKNIFGCYYDVATHILDLLISEKERKKT